ncbi:MAG: redoxin domain-containing protein [Bacteroidia bacterium]|nr:redoxin domain-containing protein [Bacteroidia bacterium]
MKSKTLIVLVISFLLCNATYSQDRQVGGSFTRSFVDNDFDLNKVYYKETGLKISRTEFLKLSQENPRLYLEREIDAAGSVMRYLYDPGNPDGKGKHTLNALVSENGAFPNFQLTTIDKKKIELTKLQGKLVILRFELEANSFRFKKNEIAELDKKINALKNKENIEAIIIFQCDEDEVRKGFDLNNSNFELVANGQNFIFKYDIHQFPSTLLIDQNGKLIEKYSDSGDIILEQHLNK